MAELQHKQGQQDHKRSAKNSLTIRNGFLSNFWWQNRKERPNRSTNYGDMVHRPKCYFVCEWVRK